MRFYRRRHSVPELNTTSTADISFMLLIFFLVTTNMGMDKGLSRQLPPADKQERQESFVAKGTMMVLRIDENGKLFVDGRVLPVNKLRMCVEDFIKRMGKRHLIKIDVAPEASYDAYFQMQNELVKAYKNWRNSVAKRTFKKDFDVLLPKQRDVIMAQCPQRIAEQYNGTMANHFADGQEGGEP